MKLLTKQNLNAISGGQSERLIITKRISIEGISEKCVQFITNPNSKAELMSLPEEIALNRLFEHCSESELDLLDEREESAPFLTVSYR